MRRFIVAAALICAACNKKNESGFEIRQRVASSGEAFSAALEQTVGSPMRLGHKIELLENGKIFPALIAAIKEAKQSVHVEMYIWSKGAASDLVLNALREATGHGVRCRILLDALGSIKAAHDDEMKAKFAAARCDLRFFRPLGGPEKDARNHRKIIVVDGRIGFTGGFGVDDRWMGDGLSKDAWRDTAVRAEGSAVNDMQEAFAENWQEAGGDMLPPADFVKFPEEGGSRAAMVRSDAAPVVTRAERLTQLAIAAAHERLWIENAYFVPSKAILDLLGKRAAEGVDVRIVTAGRKSDSKLAFLWAQTDYGELQKRGVRVWEYQPSMIHAKTMLVDKSLVIIGSVNLDPLSLNELEEVALVAEDPSTAQRMAKNFEDDCARSKEQR